MGSGSELLERAGRFVIHRLLGWRWSRRTIERLGRHVVNRANGDNDHDMATNGERALLQKLPALFAGGPVVVFDVGANLGEWTRQARTGLDVGSTVYAFEPIRDIFSRLEAHRADLGPGPRVVCVNAAMSDADGEAEIQVYGGGASGFHQRDLPGSQGLEVPRERVRCMRGDTFCREGSIERIGFLKIDVEGHELAVLRGFERMLAARRVDALQFEYGGTWIDARSWLKDAFEMLQGHGYVVGKILPSSIRWYERYEVALESFQYANYAAVLPAVRDVLGATR
jgi:FkbM family methyltransferase